MSRITIAIAILGLLAVGYLLSAKPKPNQEILIGGQRDAHGCLTPAGFAYDEEVGACIRAFEMTPGIKKAAQIAVAKTGPGYALTVVSFNSYEEAGAYDIMLERGVERAKQTVYIRNWEVTEKP